MKKTNRIRKKTRILMGGLVLVVLMIVAFVIWQDQKNQRAYQTDENETEETPVEGIYQIEYNGKKYEYNNNITSVLLIGIDSTGKIQSSRTCGNQGRADHIELLILDQRVGKVMILPISRDTMTPVHKYSHKGYDMGTEMTHLGFAYQFGDGGEKSCLNTRQAVSDLLYGITPRYYFTTNLDSIAFLNDALGGVTVTVPNSDLAGQYPELAEGNTVTLNHDTATVFLRYRDTALAYSNNGRMARQKAFLEGVVSKLSQMASDDYEALWKRIGSSESNILTNMPDGVFVQLLNKIKNKNLDPHAQLLTIEGNDGNEDGYDVFYPDQDQLKQLVIDVFYIPKG